MILEDSFPPDIRVEKEAGVLNQRNHQLYLLCREGGDPPTPEQSLLFAGIHRLPPDNPELFRKRSLEVLHQWATGRIQEWDAAILQFIEDHRLEAVHVHDLPLAGSALMAARKAGIPAIVDLHEIYPEMIRFTLSSEESPLGLKQRLRFGLLSPRWWAHFERKVVEEANRIIVVIEESKQRLIGMGVREEKVFVVSNVTDIDEFRTRADQVPPMEKDAFAVCYVGGVDNPNRGLHQLVHAWPLVLEEIPGAELWIVGDGWIRPSVEELVRSKGLEQAIKFEGQVPFGRIASYIKGADIAIIPHVVNEHTNNTIPHKLFQYLALGKIVVSSDIKPIRRVLNDTGLGVIASEWTPKGFATAITEAFRLRQSQTATPDKSLKILKEKYGFQALADSLLRLYDGLDVDRK